MYQTYMKEFWPDYKNIYKDNFIRKIKNIREGCLEYIRNSDRNKVEELCSEITNNIKKFYKVDSRATIKKSEESDLIVTKWGSYSKIKLWLSNNRCQRILCAFPKNSFNADKVIIAIHGTHESAEYFLSLLNEEPRIGHECAVGFMLPFINEGYTVICPDLPCFGDDYPGDDLDSEHFTNYIMQVDHLARFGQYSYMHEVVSRLMAVNDFLLDGFRRRVSFIGVTGYSLGAQSTMCFFACDDRLDAAIELMGLSTLEKTYQQNYKKLLTSSYVFGSGFVDCIGDHWCLQLAAFPRPYLKFSRTEDQFVNINGVHDSLSITEAAYSCGGCSCNFRFVERPGPHILDNETAQLTLEWYKLAVNARQLDSKEVMDVASFK